MSRKIKPFAIVLDVDDCIDDFGGDLCWIHNKINNTNVTSNDIKDWNFITLKVKDRNGNEVLGVDLRKTFEYWEEHGLYGSLNLLPKAREAVTVMRDFGYKIILLTARKKKYEDETKLHLWRNHIPFDEIYFREDPEEKDFKTNKIKQLSKQYNIQMFVDDKYETVEHVAENTNVKMVCLLETACTRHLKTIEGDFENKLEQNESIHKFVHLYDVIRMLRDLRIKE